MIDIGTSKSDLGFLSESFEVVTCVDLSQMDTQIAQFNLSVGVVRLSHSSDEQLFSYLQASLLVNPRFRWILTVPARYENMSKVLQMEPSVCWDYFHDPVPKDTFVNTIGHAVGLTSPYPYECSARVTREIKQNQMVKGTSKSLLILEREIKTYAFSDCPVLIRGETGTGKSRCAELIHATSNRRLEPFITVNCGAIPESLIHSELFGHEKGSFTGAASRHVGHFERANKGTLFLDEIGDLSLPMQVHLLQFLETKQLMRVGGSQWINVDCRLILATHVNLEEAVVEGNFREDLYYRINVLTMDLPAYRKLECDRVVLADNLLSELSDENKALSPASLKMIESYDWPGNVRELKNRLERACVVSESPLIEPIDMGFCVKGGIKTGSSKRSPVSGQELLATLEHSNNNISAAARKLNVSRTTMYKLMKKYLH
ncbi:hypothetical protein VSU01S_37140 [Vibrio superstes NBRC 103154]|uniref:Sigma-54 factor interaction domain-containing protein n=1 Tax=Vibrio superstes NBRC 103154 TaxID=1219062 RepID=A0A511QVS6_9VIBR|nr:hypothetical protein VSU01S_37140 [Vibrio superstes NBRC 103154]